MSGSRSRRSHDGSRPAGAGVRARAPGWALWLWLGAVAVAPALASAQETTADVDQGARSAFEKGRDAYDRGRFDEALSHFERAYELSPRPLLLFNIGRAAEADLQTEKAIRSYEAYLAAMPSAENREFVETRLQKLRAQAGQPAVRGPAPVSAPPPPPPVAPPPTAPAEYEASSSGRDAIPFFRLYGGIRLGVGGEFKESEKEDYGDDGDVGKTTYDLKARPGFQLGAAWVWRYFGIGPELRFALIKGEDFAHTQKNLDIVVKPRGGYQLTTLPLEFYLAVPIGATVAFYDYEWDEDTLDKEPEDQVGFTVGVQAGATYFFSKHIGVNAELGWVYYDYDTKVTLDGDSYSFEKSFSQFQIGANFVFGF